MVKAKSIDFTVEELRADLDYSIVTGRFYRKSTGKLAGSRAQKGAYRTITVAGRTRLEHRVAWYWVTGEWPDQIDHVNTDGTYNAWCNLRLATTVQNSYNRNTRVDNKVGVKGVFKHKGRWVAHITVNKKQRVIGYFDTLEEAKAARETTAALEHGEFVRT